LKPPGTAFNPKGQALIELVLILPLLLTFLSGAVLLLNYATVPLWLGELTNLHLRLPDIDDLYGKLEKSRESSIFPPYPTQQDLKKNTGSSNLSNFPGLLHRYYPGQIRKAEFILDLSRFIKGAFAPFGHLPGIHEPILIDLRMVPSRQFEEEYVKTRLRQIIFPGSVMETVTAKLGTLGVDLVHVNLDAIPEAMKPGDSESAK